MLFNSYEFLFFFLPCTLALFFAFSRYGHLKAAAAWMAIASLFFYGYWSPRYLVLLSASIILNFAAGQAIAATKAIANHSGAKRILVGALCANLAALAYFKYANFFVNSINSAAGLDLTLAQIVLPIGISFFTFTQIAFLVDTYQGKVRESRFIPYVLFVTFFPHLIAGPVLHHAEMMPQFAKDLTYRFNVRNFVLGTAFFAIGLFKKVVLADGVQPFVGPVFEPIGGQPLTFFEAWGGVLAYTLQLYFDFSGYSDMAIGLSKMINVDLPINFNSPYKSVNISEFWRRWHMTLSRFLRDYLYVPLGGNRKGELRRYENLMATMLLGGLWHGAGWTFVIWGGLHGIYLVVHQLWQSARVRYLGHDLTRSSALGRSLGVLLTFLCVVIAWVFFRATSFDSALAVLGGMFGLNGIVVTHNLQTLATIANSIGLDTISVGNLQASSGVRQLAWIVILMVIAWFVPNTQTLLGRAGNIDFRWTISGEFGAWMALGFMAVAVFVLAAVNGSHDSSEFIYFNF